jgi:hypothetical protein
MKKALGVIAAAMATPLAVGVLFALLALLNVGWFAGKGWGTIASNIYMYSIFGTPIALGAALVLGLPIAGRLERRGRVWAHQFALAGLVLGAVPFLVFDLLVVGQQLYFAATRPEAFHAEVFGVPATLRRLFRDVPTAAIWLGLGMWCGVCSALAYWVVVYRGSPSSLGLQPPVANAPAADA